MGALSNVLKGLSEGWNKQSSGKKLGIIVLSGGIISALIFFLVYIGKPQYEPLFLNMTTEDMGKVVEKLKQDKISYKPEGTTILVPKENVEEIRLSVASSGIMPSNGKGFELFDQSRFGMTDTETKIMYQRALETELQRTIKAYDEVEYARVHLVLPEPSAFVRTEEQARASVTLKFNHGKKLSPEQVKAVVALISGSVKNLPKENVEVIDSNFNLLSGNLFNNDITSPASVNDRYEVEKQFESTISKEIRTMLEAVFGPNKVKVTVNADLDFDAKQSTSIRYSPEQIVKNQHKIMETVTNGSSNLSGSPIDNNTSNTTPADSSGGGKTRTEETTNYNVGQVEEKTIKAPGQLKKITTSVVIDGTLTEATKYSVRNIIASAIAYDQLRGDMITVEGIPFDTSLKKQVETDLKELDAQKQLSDKNQKYITYIGYPAAVVIALLIMFLIISRMRRSKKSADRKGIDIVIDEPVAVNEIIKKQAILDDNDDQGDLTSEIKKYASKKPEQVVEIVKAWLAEDERL